MSMTVREFIEVKMNNERLVAEILKARAGSDKKNTKSLGLGDGDSSSRFRRRSALISGPRINSELSLKSRLLVMHQPSPVLGEGYCMCGYADDECFTLLSIAEVWSGSKFYNEAWSLDS